MRITKKTVSEIDYTDLEAFVNEAYGITDYSFVATEECGNDSEHSFDVTKVEELSDWDKEVIEEFVKKNGHRSYCNRMILQDLVNKGKLEPAEYLVTVCW